MLKRIVWKEGGVISFFIRERLYTLAQMRISPYMQFYDVSSVDGTWVDVDLNKVPSLFCVAVSDKRLKPLMAETVDLERVIPDRREMPKHMINARLNFDGGYPFKGGDLVLLSEQGNYVDAPVIQADLQVGRDDALIRDYELTNMWVDPEKLRNRLLRYFETGVNWDVHKEQVFPGLKPA